MRGEEVFVKGFAGAEDGVREEEKSCSGDIYSRVPISLHWRWPGVDDPEAAAESEKRRGIVPRRWKPRQTAARVNDEIDARE